MGILGDLFNFDPFQRPSRAARREMKAFREGEPGRGVLRGIRVRDHTGDAGTVWRWAIELQPGGERVCLRQGALPQDRDALRLGAPVDVRRHEDVVVLAWDETGPGGWGRVGDAGDVPDGIDDGRLPRLQGTGPDLVVEGWRPHRLMGMPTQDIDLLVAGEWRTVRPPEYAGHLLAPGTALPADERGRIDWLGALERHGTGVGVPTPPPTHPEHDDTRVQDAMTSFVERFAGISHETPEITFEQWVEVSAGLVRDRVHPRDYDEYATRHGVPPGGWAAGEAAWKGRLTSDWELATRFSEAYERALKAKR